MIYLITRSVAQGKKAGFAAALGINTGGYIHLAAAILGISAIIATSATAYTLLKWCGAAYLIFIGLKAILSSSKVSLSNKKEDEHASIKTIFWQGFVSDVLNPKVAIFFISLLPQFVHTQSGNILSQLLLLGITVNVIALVINMALVWFSHSITRQLRQSNRFSRVLNHAMGTVFIVLGLKLANE